MFLISVLGRQKEVDLCEFKGQSGLHSEFPGQPELQSQNKTKKTLFLKLGVTQWKKSASAASMRTGVNLKYHMESGERLCMPITPTLGD